MLDPKWLVLLKSMDVLVFRLVSTLRKKHISRLKPCHSLNPSLDLGLISPQFSDSTPDENNDEDSCCWWEGGRIFCKKRRKSFPFSPATLSLYQLRHIRIWTLHCYGEDILRTLVRSNFNKQPWSTQTKMYFQTNVE